MNARLVILVALVLGQLAAAQDLAPTAEAGDTAAVDRDIGPLKDRIPPVTGYSFSMARRLEIAPTFSLSFRDAFWTKYVAGATITYHFTETIGLALRGGYAFTSVSGSAQVCPSPTEACFSPSKEQLDGKGPGQIKLISALDFEWAPLYGKISLLAEGFAHFNLYLIAGPTAIQYKAPKDGNVAGSESAWAVGGEAGLGMRFVFNRWMALRFELRDVIYREKTQGATETTGAGYQVRNQLFFDVGLSFFFPNSFSEG